MAVRAKMRVTQIAHHETHGPGQVCAQVRLVAVSGVAEENKSWSKYTPSGEIMLTITNPDAIEAFKLGTEYFLDFTPAA